MTRLATLPAGVQEDGWLYFPVPDTDRREGWHRYLGLRMRLFRDPDEPGRAIVQQLGGEADEPEYETDGFVASLSAAGLRELAADLTAAADELEEEPAHFDISDDGVMTALPAWPRNDHTTMLRLMMALIKVDEPTIATWTDEQCKAAEVWACSVHLSASDNDDIVVPPKPDFLPDYAPFRGIIPDAAGP